MTIKIDRSTSDILITLEDFKDSAWEEAFRGSCMRDHVAISDILSKKCEKAAEEGKMAQSKVLGLLASVSSMQLQPESVHEPFVACFRSCTERSAVPDDFSEHDLDFFVLILPVISEPWLKARLSDVIWLRRRSKVNLALTAIDSYITTPISLEAFAGDGGNCWIRAIKLTSILKQAAGERMTDIQDMILKAIRSTTENDGFLVNWLSELLYKFGLGISYENEIAEKLFSLAEVFKAQSAFYNAREYYESASHWFVKADKERESLKSVACKAEVWCAEAQALESCHNFEGAASCLENAIQTNLLIPNKHRADFDIDAKLPQLKLHLNKMGKLAADSMTPISTLLIDISIVVAESRHTVHGKTVLEALTILANLYPGASTIKIRSTAEQALMHFRFDTFFSLITRSRDGRVVAKTPGMAAATKGTKEYEEAVWNEMLHSYYLEIGVVVQGRIIPALETIIAEHRLQVRDFMLICSQASIIPPNRAAAFGKALFAGYDLDFDSAIHRLVPQLENMVRYHLKAAGAVTTTINEDGVVNEINLSALLEKPEAVQVFGEDVVFEMKALFCDSRGPSFRHNFAHGLLEDKDFCSAFAVYAWCFVLRLAINVFWNTSRKK